MKNILLSLFLLFSVFVSTHAAESESVDTGKVVASLVSSHNSVAPGQTINVALRTILDPGWHTYWVNPGDSGEPVQLSWSLPDGWETGDIVWPLPLPIPTGPIINYGFEGAPLFPVSLTVPSDAAPGTTETINLDFYYLVCKDICIPEDGSASITLQIGKSEVDARWNALIQDAINTAPKFSDISGGIIQQDDKAVITLQSLEGADFGESYFFPYDQGVIVHSDPQLISIGSEGIRIETTADYAWKEELPESIKGVISYSKDGVRMGSEIAFKVGDLLDVGVDANISAINSIGSVTIFGAIIGALMGGLILNLMPCVFPVISMKALSIAKTAHGERVVIRREAWAYTAGVLATFLALTVLLLALKAAGNEIGWGFQLQSPPVVAILALILFAVGLNLLGVFEIGGNLQNTGSGLTQPGGLRGSFFTGLLAVIVATPCTAPFMAGAMGYAMAQPAAVTLAVFMSLAIGFALPFLLIAYVPGVLKALPKPGPWMVTFKEILAFPMFAAAIWLVWVLSLQAGANGVAIVLLAMLLIGLSIWLFKRSHLVAKGIAILAVIGALFLSVGLRTEASVSTELKAEAWSHEKVTELRQNGQAVFVDFTAAWCVTCKVNEMTVLNRPNTQALFAETNTAFLVADWTNKDDVIAAELEAYGRAGVPLYLVFSPYENGQVDNSVRAEVLPQVLTYDVIKNALERATNTS